MSAHTPGPWEPIDDQIVTADAGIPICDLHLANEVAWGGPDLIAEAEANARLIAAAPDLLAALKAAADELHYGAGKARTVKAAHTLFAAEQEARAAIAKAEGTP